VNLVRLNQLIDQARRRRCALRARAGLARRAWPRGASIFERLRAGDVLLHHPFESFEPVVQFLREAVHDPEVLAIKQTIYRTGAESVLMDLLIEAARRGKEVTGGGRAEGALRRRGQHQLGRAPGGRGRVQVVYGIVGLKTHAKLLLSPDATRGRAGCGATCTCPPATTTRARRGCTPTWAPSPPTAR
jgi:polyphosphate kinase